MNRTLVIEFTNRNKGKKFIKSYKTQLTNIANKAAKQLNYSVSVESDLNFNSTSKKTIYAIGNSNMINFQKYVTKYAPTSVKILQEKGADLISADFQNTNCIIGNCEEYNVLIGFKSKREFRGWYHNNQYRMVLPVRKSVTRGGGLQISKAK